MKKIIIAIDGPAGAGKGELASQIAKKYNLINVCSGSFYRAYSYHLINKFGYDYIIDLLNSNNKEKIEKELANNFSDFDLSYSNDNNSETVILNDEDISKKIRQDQVTHLVSYISNIIPIRKQINNFLQLFSDKSKTGIVMEGRDIATVVYPNADLKIYLDSDVKIRAQRRHLQNLEKGIESSYEKCLENLELRDHNDYTKEFGKLEKTDKHTIIDNSNLSIDETLSVTSKYIDEVISE